MGPGVRLRLPPGPSIPTLDFIIESQMNKKNIVLLVLSCLLVASCSTNKSSEGKGPIMKNAIIIHGYGLIPKYDVEKATNIAFTASQKFSLTLHSNLDSFESQVDLHGNYDRSKKTRDFVPYMLAAKNYDSLIQVSIDHIKNESENTIYLQADYFPLTWSIIDGKKVATPQQGITKKYKLLSSEKSFSEPSISGIAINFCKYLRKEGLTKSECQKI